MWPRTTRGVIRPTEENMTIFCLSDGYLSTWSILLLRCFTPCPPEDT